MSDQSDHQNSQPNPTDVTMESLQAEIESLHQELEKEKEAKLMARADMENYRKRADEEKAKYGLMTNLMLVHNLIDIINDLQLAKQDESIDVTRSREVFAILDDKLNAAVSLAGVARLEVNKGDEFDAGYMEAITTIPGEQNNEIVDVINHAYKHLDSGQIIKSAKVVVSKKG